MFMLEYGMKFFPESKKFSLYFFFGGKDPQESHFPKKLLEALV